MRVPLVLDPGPYCVLSSRLLSDVHFIKFTTGQQDIFSEGKISKFAECKVQVARSIRLIYRAPSECE